MSAIAEFIGIIYSGEGYVQGIMPQGVSDGGDDGGGDDGEEPDLSGKLFQSTRPRGARRSYKACKVDQVSFNPRAREGRDALCDVGCNGDD